MYSIKGNVIINTVTMNGDKVIDLLWEVKEGIKHPNKAYKELLNLFSVSNNENDSEVAVCKHCGYAEHQHSKHTRMCPNMVQHFEAN